MDLSKLPKLSDTPPPPTPSPPPSQPPGNAAPITAGVGAEIWISAIVGIVLMLLGRSFAAWAFTTLTGGTYDTNVVWYGTPVDYWELAGGVALTDSGVFLLGLALILEAVALLAAMSGTRIRGGLILFAFVITVVATVYNATVAIALFSKGILPLLSILAIGFGGYIAAYEYRLLKQAK